MHETMVAKSLLSLISDEAGKHGARPARARISCGSLYAINDEVLRFAFEAISRDTPCEGLELRIEHKPIRGRCARCGNSFDVEFSRPQCPNCGEEDFEMLPDAPLVLEEIEFDTEASNAEG